MANAKKITLDYSQTGITAYCIIRREADGYLLNDATGSFASAPADPYISMTEDGTIKGRYEKSESRSAWNDGRYTIVVYKQAGGSPSPVADTVIGSGEMSIVSDTEVPVLTDKTVDLVWDEVLTKSTHNVANSAGKRLRLLGDQSMHSGTAQAGGGNTITLEATASASNDIYKEALVIIVDGTATGEAHHILAYNGTTKVAVVDEDWHTAPDATSEYVIFGSSAHDALTTGLTQAATSNSITLNGAASTSDGVYVNCMAVIPSGTGAGQARRITGYVGSTKAATVSPAWAVTPDTTSPYMIYPMTVVATADSDNISSILTHAIAMSKWKNNKLAKTGTVGAVETWVLYDDDSVTPLLTWSHDTSTSARAKAV